MLKINQLNMDFKEKGFLVTAGSYNRLLDNARVLARACDVSYAEETKRNDEIWSLNRRIDTLNDLFDELKARYKGAQMRDLKTGRYTKT